MEKFFKPYDCDSREYEARLASSREIWDDFSHEWSYSPFDEKIVILGGFALKGGNFKRAIERYAEERAETYRSRIHWVIFAYIWRMMMGKESQFETEVDDGCCQCKKEKGFRHTTDLVE